MGVEVAVIECELELSCGFELDLLNPIGAEYDLADMYIAEQKQKLAHSRYYHAWDNEHEALFSNKMGIWLFSTAEKVYFFIGMGLLKEINSNSNFQAIPHPEEALFFPIPEEKLSAKSLKIKVTVVYTG